MWSYFVISVNIEIFTEDGRVCIESGRSETGELHLRHLRLALEGIGVLSAEKFIKLLHLLLKVQLLLLFVSCCQHF